MLKVLRDNLKYLAWILWLVIAVFVFFVFADFGSWMPGRRAAVDTAATVGGEKITFGELRRRYKGMERQFRQLYGEQYTSEVAGQLQRRALQDLINQKVLLAEAQRMGLSVSNEELAREILEQFQGADGRFVGDETYRRILRQNDFGNVQEYEESLREDLLRQKLFDILRQNLVVGEGEVEEAYRESVERAKIRYFQVLGSRYSEEVEVGDEEIADYFTEHQADYRLPERRAVSYLLVDTNLVRRDLPIDESELFSYYQEHQSEFTREEQVRARHILIDTNQRSVEEARSRIEQVRRRIEGGEDFAAVAREVSEDPGSKDRGGELGFFGRGQMTPEFEQAAFGAPAGTLAGPVQTPFGFHLLEVEERREGGVQPFAEVRGLIHARLANDRAPEAAETRARSLAETLAGESEVGTEQLQALAPEGGAVIFNQPEPFGRDDVVPGIGRDQAFADAVFGLEPGQLSEPVKLGRGWALVLLREIQEPRDRELEEVREEVRGEIVRREEKQLAVDRLAEMKQDIEGGKTLDQAAEELGAIVQEPAEFGPRGIISGLGPSPGVVEAAFAAEEGRVQGPFETPQGAILFEVVERTSWDPEAFESEREATRQRLEGDKLNRMLSSMVLERRRELGVQYSLQLEAELTDLQG